MKRERAIMLVRYNYLMGCMARTQRNIETAPKTCIKYIRRLKGILIEEQEEIEQIDSKMFRKYGENWKDYDINANFLVYVAAIFKRYDRQQKKLKKADAP